MARMLWRSVAVGRVQGLRCSVVSFDWEHRDLSLRAKRKQCPGTRPARNVATTGAPALPMRRPSPACVPPAHRLPDTHAPLARRAHSKRAKRAPNPCAACAARTPKACQGKAKPMRRLRGACTEDCALVRSACAPRTPRVDSATQGVGNTPAGDVVDQRDRLPGGHPGGI